MGGVMRLMDQAARNLQIEFDAGAPTQTIQARIIDKLNEAIQTAAAQRRPTPRCQSSGGGDKRRRPDSERDEDKRPGASPDNQDAPDAATTQPEQGVSDGSGKDGALWESRRSWGHLPDRERDEIIQGVEEESLERYRAWIERYYRALQMQDE